MTHTTTSMDCTDIAAVLSGILDDELDAPVRHAAERHLATCADCRQTIGNAERLDGLFAQQVIQHETLPPGFEARVLAATILADRPLTMRHPWTTWAGWFAAAASLVLAVTIWIIDDAPRADQPSNNINIAAVDRTLPHDDHADPDTATPSRAVLSKMRTAINSPPPASFTTDRYGTPRQSHRLDPAHARTTSAIVMILEDLVSIDADSTRDISRVQRLVARDDVLSRLNQTRAEVDAIHRPALLAAESILIRFAQAPVDAGDIRLMQQTIEELNLINTLHIFTGQGTSNTSL